MSLVGRLEEISLPELLHMVSWSQKTGKLIFTRPDGEGIIAFRRGRIIYAASSSVREALGNILVCRKVIDEATLLQALERQHRSSEERRLGAILTASGATTQAVVDDIVREQTVNVLAEFFRWRSGFFRFQALDIADSASLQVDSAEFLYENGLNTEQLVLEVVKQLDEAERRRNEASIDIDPSLPDTGAGAREPSPVRPAATVRSIMAEFQPPALRAEVTLAILRCAEKLVRRGVLFIPSGDVITATAQFGIELPGSSADERVRNIILPRDHRSVLADVLSSRETYAGKMPSGVWNDYLIRQLGGQVPREVVAIPATANGDAVAVFYGDNLPYDEPIAPVTTLEIAMMEAGHSLARKGRTSSSLDELRDTLNGRAIAS